MELLSPAGGFDSLKAAIENGADAVYVGAQNFSARNLAENFGDIAQAVSYTHAAGVKLYLALNTLVRDREIAAWIGTAKEAAAAGIDAFIVQDLGCAMLLKRLCPDVPLHASTQMTAYSARGVQVLTELGFSRVILARELSFAQICNIREQTDAELEIFVHGALCVCYSGQCLMSSMFGGRSANRGLCAQPCRLDYKLENKSGRLLSPKDMCLVDYIGDIKDAGIASIKIEGRMKPAQYVGTATRIYRKALDGGRITQKDKDDLLKAFSRRGFTSRPFSAKMPETIQRDERLSADESVAHAGHISFGEYTALPKGKKKNPHALAAQVLSKKQALSVLDDVDILYVPCNALWAQEVVTQAHQQSKKCIGIHPLVDREDDCTPSASFDGEMYATLLHNTTRHKVANLSFNVMNSETLHTLHSLGYERATLSAELNLAQIRDICSPIPTEVVVYGRATLMTTIYCPIKCDKKSCRADGNLFLTDRMGKRFPIIKADDKCCVRILNSLPIFMADKLNQVSADVLRLVFTTESLRECRDIARQYRLAMQGKSVKPSGEFTRGHFLRGVN
ncbi:MAG: U32 family peptidase [Christensenella sp.]|uniref:U32 family peptidase n=1 Tax=Christensenella sp. TaxID=1935934 RepID=UPI002B21E1E1|nr:U32 family peptidase [Christensenella sp.]MEA5001982.1 U32 family peptidase [Christensenella sp.]